MLGVNLLPPELKTRRWRFFDLKIVAIAMLLVLAISFAFFPLENYLLARRLKLLEDQIALLNPQVEKVKGTAASLERAAAEVRVLRQKAEIRRSLSPILENLEAALPAGVWLTELQISSQGELNLAGKATGFEKAGELLRNLQANARLKEVVLAALKTDPEGPYLNFLVKAKL